MSCREANLTLQGLGEGGGKCVLYQVGGCWTASRRETSGIDWRYSVGPKLLEHGVGGVGGGGRRRPVLQKPHPKAPGAIVDSGDSHNSASATQEAGPGRRHKTPPQMPWREGRWRRRRRGGEELADVCISSTKTQEDSSVEYVSLFN